MHAPNLATTPERILPQQFEGSIGDFETRVGLNTLVTPILDAEISNGGSILISSEADSPVLGKVMGAPVMAEMELGGDDRYSPLSAKVLRVDEDNAQPGMTHMLRTYRAEHNYVSGPVYVIAVGSEFIESFTVIDRHTHMGYIGRDQNNMDWYDGYGQRMDGGHGSPELPVSSNRSLSEVQLMVSYEEKGLYVTGQTGDSKTVVHTVATQQHRDVLARNQDGREAVATHEAAPRRRKLHNVAKALGLVSSRRSTRSSRS